MIKLWEEYNKY